MKTHHTITDYERCWIQRGTGKWWRYKRVSQKERKTETMQGEELVKENSLTLQHDTREHTAVKPWQGMASGWPGWGAAS